MQIKQGINGGVAFRTLVYHLMILFASLGRYPHNRDAASVRRRPSPGLSAKSLDGCRFFPRPATHMPLKAPTPPKRGWW